jgi:sialate O-acetylesterase
VADVLVGEVWLGSGQSNMSLNVSVARNFEEERTRTTPAIRMFTVRSKYADEPQPDCEGQWVVAGPDTVGRFSATAYYFGRELHAALGVPVGLIASSVGGTPIESWVSSEAMSRTAETQFVVDLRAQHRKTFDGAAAKERYERELAAWEEKAASARAEGRPAPGKPNTPESLLNKATDVGGLFNGMIAPLIPYAIRGALWYQGEHNASPQSASYYGAELRLLIDDWRSRWAQGDFPMAWVQLPNFNASVGWPMVREQMLRTLAVPHTGMAITIDIGEADDVHPKNKQDVGKRLALWALGTVYGKKSVASSGPLPAGQRVRGKEMVVTFSHAHGGLRAHGPLGGFVIAGEDRVWHAADARIAGNAVVVSNREVPHPVAVRYLWDSNPTASLFNGAGLPATPFRTDDWLIVTKPPARPLAARGP